MIDPIISFGEVAIKFSEIKVLYYMETTNKEYCLRIELTDGNSFFDRSEKYKNKSISIDDLMLEINYTRGYFK